MTLIKVKTNQVLSIGEMHRLALKKVFEPEKLTYPEEKALEESIALWPKKVDLSGWEKHELKLILEAMILNEDGHYNGMKELFKEHGIDYQKAYREGIS